MDDSKIAWTISKYPKSTAKWMLVFRSESIILGFAPYLINIFTI
jgi:hypothetical protein